MFAVNSPLASELGRAAGAGSSCEPPAEGWEPAERGASSGEKCRSRVPGAFPGAHRQACSQQASGMRNAAPRPALHPRPGARARRALWPRVHCQHWLNHPDHGQATSRRGPHGALPNRSHVLHRLSCLRRGLASGSKKVMRGF